MVGSSWDWLNNKTKRYRSLTASRKFLLMTLQEGKVMGIRSEENMRVNDTPINSYLSNR